ncbi:MAG: ABC transporter ATP-binding protein [Acidaminococcales bacterium]|jgi:branched-chain amino acid transport system ATP-binding protein|nr:ABC transporter ATP-binding protein [Acidaminococcales bacterium]
MELLSVKDLTINFGGVTAVSKVSFSLAAGEMLGIIGPNGSGKTTLFNLLSGIYQPSAGTIALNGAPIQGLPANKIFNLGISRTFQNGRLFWNLNVVENIIIGLEESRAASIFGAIFAPAREKALQTQAIQKAMEIMGIFGSLLVSQADKLAKDLPYADRRRLEICRAIASGPKVLLLDEPSAGMDSLETERLMNDLLKVKKSLPDLSIIVVEHDMGFIKGLVDKVMVLNYGENIAYGTFADIAGNEQVINAYLGQEDGR